MIALTDPLPHEAVMIADSVERLSGEGEERYVLVGRPAAGARRHSLASDWAGHGRARQVRTGQGDSARDKAEGYWDRQEIREELQRQADMMVDIPGYLANNKWAPNYTDF